MNKNRRMQTALAWVTLLLALSSCVRHGDEDLSWPLVIVDGKSDVMFGQAAAFSETKDDSYVDVMLALCPWNLSGSVSGSVAPDVRQRYSFTALQRTELGRFGRYRVVDFTSQEMQHKAVALVAEDGQAFLVYLQFEWSTAFSDFFPRLYELNNAPLLELRTQVPGTGNGYIEYYITINEQGNPSLVDTSAIASELAAKLPAGYGVWKGGGLTMQDLVYSALVWQPGDPNCCPTGGRIRLQLELSGSRLVVIDSQYDQLD